MDWAASGHGRRRTGPMRPLVIIGNTASGKTTVGRRIAEILEVPFWDLDELIVARHGSLSQIFTAGGEDAFRDLEAKTAAEVITAGTSQYVLSFGGGAIMRPETQQLLNRVSVIWIDANLETVLPRLHTRRNRPIFKGDLAARWKALDGARRPVFRQLADLRIDASCGSVDQIASLAADWATDSPQLV